MSDRDIGAMAFRAGFKRHENPFPRGTREFVEWLIGWRKAEKEFLENLK